MCAAVMLENNGFRNHVDISALAPAIKVTKLAIARRKGRVIYAVAQHHYCYVEIASTNANEKQKKIIRWL